VVAAVIIAAMFRLVALLLALLLPLQFAWGAAAVYCEHETTPRAAGHFGHHEHVHEDAADAKKPAGGKQLVDNDCASCHAAGSAVAADAPPRLASALAVGRVASPTAPPPASAFARAPDRPSGFVSPSRRDAKLPHRCVSPNPWFNHEIR
jgi:mono/diheme cytochrome c family protein